MLGLVASRIELRPREESGWCELRRVLQWITAAAAAGGGSGVDAGRGGGRGAAAALPEVLQMTLQWWQQASRWWPEACFEMELAPDVASGPEGRVWLLRQACAQRLLLTFSCVSAGHTSEVRAALRSMQTILQALEHLHAPTGVVRDAMEGENEDTTMEDGASEASLHVEVDGNYLEEVEDLRDETWRLRKECRYCGRAGFKLASAARGHEVFCIENPNKRAGPKTSGARVKRVIDEDEPLIARVQREEKRRKRQQTRGSRGGRGRGGTGRGRRGRGGSAAPDASAPDGEDPSSEEDERPLIERVRRIASGTASATEAGGGNMTAGTAPAASSSASAASEVAQPLVGDEGPPSLVLTAL